MIAAVRRVQVEWESNFWFVSLSNLSHPSIPAAARERTSNTYIARKEGFRRVCSRRMF